jgi:hypothetical protein
MSDKNRGNRPIHVVPHRGGGWATRREGADRVGSRHETQESAIEAGRNRARREHTELFIHGRNGRIRDRDSFGNDPFPPRDRRH